jgi:hypothetical protein
VSCQANWKDDSIQVAWLTFFLSVFMYFGQAFQTLKKTAAWKKDRGHAERSSAPTKKCDVNKLQPFHRCSPDVHDYCATIELHEITIDFL